MTQLRFWTRRQFLFTERAIRFLERSVAARPQPGTNGHASAGALRGLKSHIWEGGHRVPFIARWPGRIERGAVVDEPVSLTDLIATFGAVAGADLPS